MYVCFYCKKKFEERKEVDTHILTEHNGYRCTENNCDSTLVSYNGLRKHLCRTHKHILKDNFNYFVMFYLDNVTPLCQCGCREILQGIVCGYDRYKIGHVLRVENLWKTHPEVMKKAFNKSCKTRRKLFKEDKIQVWNKGKKGLQSNPLKGFTKDTHPVLKKISEKLKIIAANRPKNFYDNFFKKSKEYWSKDENKQKQRERTIKRIENYTIHSSELESIFEQLLITLNIDYESQYSITEIGFFDFYLPEYNILIEVDGDWWHCNPNLCESPEYPVQYINIKKDKLKNEWSETNNIKLLRFWESDIHQNIMSVATQLLNEIQRFNARE